MVDHPPRAEEFIGYALNGAGVFVHVSEVPRGKACACRCVACRQPVIAKKGEVRVHHFAHAHEVECTGALETVLHRLAKDILREAHQLWLPAYVWKTERVVGEQTVAIERKLFGGGRLTIDAVEIEVEGLDGVRPDARIHWTGSAGRRKQLLIEIAVRHRVDRSKLSKLQQLGLPAIEIHMEPSFASQPREEIRQALLRGMAGKQWLYHPAEVKVQHDFEAAVARAEEAWQRERASRTAYIEGRIRKMWIGRSIPPARRKHWGMAEILDFERRLARFQAQHRRLPDIKETREMIAAMDSAPARPR